MERARVDWTGLDRVAPELRRSLVGMLPDENELEDVVQEALLRAARYRQGLEDPGRLLAWTRRIARNVSRDRRRNEWRRRRPEEDERLILGLEGREPVPGDEPAGVLVRVDGEEVELAHCLRHLGPALGELEERDRQLLLAYYHEDLDTAAVARRCSIRRNNVKLRLYRARRRLAERLRRRLAAERVDRLMAGWVPA